MIIPIMSNINEARKSFVRLQAEYKKGNQFYYLCEGKLIPSHRSISSNTTNSNLNEDYEILCDNQTSFEYIKELAEKMAKKTNMVFITEQEEYDGIKYFSINHLNGMREPYTIYQIDEKIYYMPTSKFNEDISLINEHTSPYNILIEDKDYIVEGNKTAAKDLVDTLIIENAHIILPKFSCEGDIDNSKYIDDILHGTKEQQDFEKHVEIETQKAGVDNPLAPMNPQQESLQPTFDKALLESIEFEYEPEDWVLIKQLDNMKAQVVDVVNDGEGNLKMLTVVASNGSIYDVDPDEIEPDPIYLQNVPGCVVNSQNLVVPESGQFDIDPKTRMTKPAVNDKPEELADLNGKTIHVYLKDKGTMGTTSYKALVSEIMESKKTLHVMNEDTLQVNEYDATNDLEFPEMPYAVLVDAEGKPRKPIQIDPLSYINAQDDEPVDCLIDGKMTQVTKTSIDVLS